MTRQYSFYVTTSIYAITEEEKIFFQDIANLQRLDFDSNLIVWYDYDVNAIFFMGHIIDLMNERYYSMVVDQIALR